MIDLLDLTVAAHGRLDRYNQFKTVSAHLGLGGRMWVLKGQEEVMKDPRVRVTVDLHREYASLAPFKLPNQHTAFTPDRVAVETTEGAIIDHRINPRAAFGGHTRETPWDNLHFTGEASPPALSSSAGPAHRRRSTLRLPMSSDGTTNQTEWRLIHESAISARASAAFWCAGAEDHRGDGHPDR